MDNVNTNAYEKIGGVTLDLSWYDGNDYYSEGANEDYLLSLVKEHEESEYDGLILGSRLWSAMYHLKPTRENIVSFLPAGKDMSVLEIGAGCGAVTGALSELFGSVDCIELSRKRSLINAYRHKDRNNIEIIVGNFETIEPSITKKYDYITLIGVLEYAESYLSKVSGQDLLAPYYELIRRAESHLKEGGKLVVAIENKYGLKYFAGCKEDHTGGFFDGIEGYPKGAGVRTFSKGGLTKLLSSVFPVEQLSFYYPYPDYKLP
ncbi:MAG: class I SAM-dependent methyltransferase, partial [Lachnospiraceae bacterium]|nr:class I SAM-dependent methyltransferase [Lachnospiraceae bacterium]